MNKQEIANIESAKNGMIAELAEYSRMANEGIITSDYYTEQSLFINKRLSALYSALVSA